MDPWSLFWRQGHSTTFGDYFKQGYEGAVADWWRSQLESAPEGVSVVEVGCGNCSLLPAMIRAGRGGRYVGVDIATVQPSAVAQEVLADGGIDCVLHSNTPAEDIPEADASADIVASVFGIEYSDLSRSIPEAARILKPGGRLCLLLHHHDSVVTKMSRRAISEFNGIDVKRVINSLNAISEERDRLASLAELKNSTKAETGRSRINALAQKYLSDTNPATANATMFEFMTNALKFFKMMGADSEQRRGFIAMTEAEHRASHERFEQMVSVAQDEAGMNRLKALLESAGFSGIEFDTAKTGQDILAWEMEATKPE